jgi:hypothetical protein
MKVKLNDTLHFSELGRDANVAGDVVDLPEAQAKDLIKRGLAKAEGASSRTKAEGRSKSTKRG